MKIGIPNIIPGVAYILYAVATVFITVMFIDKIDTATTGTMIAIVVFVLLCYGMFVFMSYHLKIVVMTDERMIIIMPFRFLYKNFCFDDIVSIDWSIWAPPKLGEYRRLSLRTNSNFNASISDFEFINYNGLEECLIGRTNLELDLKKRKNIELVQAKENRWWNLVVIIMSFVFLIMISINGNNDSKRLIIQTILIVLIIRLAIVFIEYQKRISNSPKKK